MNRLFSVERWARPFAIALATSMLTPLSSVAQQAEAPVNAPPNTRIAQAPASGSSPTSSATTPRAGDQQLDRIVVSPPRPEAAKPRPRRARSLAPRPVPQVAQAPKPVPALPPGVIVNPNLPVDFTTAGPVQGYKALTATSATRTNTPIESIPQSIQVIPRSVIEDQQSVNIEEALRNVSAVVPTNSLQTPAYESTRIRGFPAEQWTDGLVNYYNAGNRDSLVNVERIEVLKGPNAILYGGGSGAPLGGVVNVVSKLPTDKAFGEIGVTLGSHSFGQPYFDFNQPLNKEGTALFRMTGEYTTANSFIDVLETQRWSLNPTLLLTNKEDTTLLLQARFSNWQQQDYQGLPATGTLTGSFRINPDLFIGPSNIPQSYSNTQSLTAKLDHTFNNVWSVNVTGQIGKTQFREYAQSIVGADGFAANQPFFPPSSWGMANADLYQQQSWATINASALAKFNVGITSNKFLIGADYSNVSDKGYIDAAFVNDPAWLPFQVPYLVDLANPTFLPYSVPGPGINQSLNTYITKGAYAQLQTDVADRIHLLGGVRLAGLQIDSSNVAVLPAVTDVTDTTKVLPRVGAIVDIVRGFSVFADYSQGMKANPFVHYLGPPQPEMSEQVEGGIKFDTGTGLSGSLALFNILRTGVPVAIGLYSEAIGREQSRGVELDVLYQPNRNWSVIGNYAHVEAKLLNAIPAVGGLPGNWLNFVPPDSGRIWVNYKFDPGVAKGWSVGAGVYAASGAYVDLANMYLTGAYYTVDAKVAYDDERISASLTAKNLTGQKYYVPYNYFGGRVAPGDDRAIYGKIAFKYQ